jgi:AraC family transcriptional regulator, regulatory protein of adaptative response / methylated-DNA-[protein]-cysteine methyltransferase
MNLMTSKAAFRPTPAATHDNAGVDIISHATGECALGQVLVARSVSGVCAILIGARRGELEAELAARFPDAELVANEVVVHDDMAKVIRFVDRPAEGLHLTLEMRGTPFQRHVWEKLRAIPVGRTVTLHGVGPLDRPPGIAPCGRWCAANPIALAIPCHRVVRTDGDLAGYRWGIERKVELIRKEAIV